MTENELLVMEDSWVNDQQSLLGKRTRDDEDEEKSDRYTEEGHTRQENFVQVPSSRLEGSSMKFHAGERDG